MTTQQAIQQHGAKAVYQAAVEAMRNNPEPLQRLGLTYANLGEAYQIMLAAHAQMSEADKAIDAAQANASLSDHEDRQ